MPLSLTSAREDPTMFDTWPANKYQPIRIASAIASEAAGRRLPQNMNDMEALAREDFQNFPPFDGDVTHQAFVKEQVF